MAADDNQRDGNDKKENTSRLNIDRTQILLLVILTLMVAGFSVGGTLFLVKVLGDSEAEVLADDPKEQLQLPNQAIYYPLNPAIVVNFSVRGRQRFLQAELSLMLRDPRVISAIELHQPVIRNALVLLMGGQMYEELQTPEGKELLRQKALQEIQGILKEEIGRPGIEQVLFTSFIMQ